MKERSNWFASGANNQKLIVFPKHVFSDRLWLSKDRTQTNQWQRKRKTHWLSTRDAHPLRLQKANIIHLSLNTDAQHTYRLADIGGLTRDPQDYLDSNFTGSSPCVFSWGIFLHVVSGKRCADRPLVRVRSHLTAFVRFHQCCVCAVWFLD